MIVGRFFNAVSDPQTALTKPEPRISIPDLVVASPSPRLLLLLALTRALLGRVGVVTAGGSGSGEQDQVSEVGGGAGVALLVETGSDGARLFYARAVFVGAVRMMWGVAYDEPSVLDLAVLVDSRLILLLIAGENVDAASGEVSLRVFVWACVGLWQGWVGGGVGLRRRIPVASDGGLGRTEPRWDRRRDVVAREAAKGIV